MAFSTYGGLAVLTRFTPPGKLPPGVVADFDKTKAIRYIDKAFYDQEATEQQRRVLDRTELQIVVKR